MILTPICEELQFPLINYRVNSYQFGQNCVYDGESWGIHLGEDMDAEAGTQVHSIGDGVVVLSKMNAGDDGKKNWGNIIMVVHRSKDDGKFFYSIYSHLLNRKVKEFQKIMKGDVLGLVGRANTRENGYWPEEHLHFGIYFGPWEGEILPGYWRVKDERMDKYKKRDWISPSFFIKKYNE